MKLVAIDLDGTLLNSHHVITQKNKEEINRVKSMGIDIVIATGRSVNSSVDIINELCGDAYLIALNGTYITQVNKRELIRPIRRKVLSKKDIKKAFEVSMEENVTFILSNEFGSDRVLCREDTELVQEFLTPRADLKDYNPTQMRQMLSETSTDYLKIAFTVKDQKKLLELQKKLKLQGINTIFSDEYYIECLPEKTNKGTALEYLCEYLGYDVRETIAFGDQENDIEMLTVSGVGIAMGNAKEHVKKSADYVTLTNENSGVASALRKLF